ncbi:MAG: 3-oxoacyl-ACP reductase [Bacteroidetes bacterium GWF2_38_335]|nr:MAG: 3-oxoacyl-ACP reductase [Bacteroidetes bacterium GWF2_38_335]OFY77124.1 MAG: 3-oxoacyl-ACP reductase [Bacteroidetes bacterium RIFOXYA12_FULL_38_20]HBS85015.1 3-oxoacyl-ACP reductase [Bacteroidales bacterium]
MKNIIITGASRGLGLETANLLIKKGYKVIGISRTKSNELNTLLLNNKEQFEFIEFDLGNPRKVQDELFKKYIKYDTPIYGFVNNAAIAYDDIATNMNLDSLENMFNINVFSPMLMTKNIIRNMLLNKIKGSLIHISSISCHTGYKGLSMYASSKSSIEAFSKNIAREWGPLGIRSNSIVAGFMETDMSSSLDESQKNRIYGRTSLKLPTSTLSVANTIEFLLSQESGSITGQNIFVDSGTI